MRKRALREFDARPGAPGTTAATEIADMIGCPSQAANRPIQDDGFWECVTNVPT